MRIFAIVVRLLFMFMFRTHDQLLFKNNKIAKQKGGANANTHFVCIIFEFIYRCWHVYLKVFAYIYGEEDVEMYKPHNKSE